MSNSVAALLFAVIHSLIAADEALPFKVTTKRDNDRVEVIVEKDQTIFSIHSPFGISQVVIERTSEKWPDVVVLRLHLKGLENFEVTSGKVKLEAAASMQEGKPLVRAWKDSKENSPFDVKCPHRIDVHILGGDGQPARELPLEDGYFELKLPKALFEDNPKTITATWIDFYRN